MDKKRFRDLKGEVIKSVKTVDDYGDTVEVIFKTESGYKFKLYHRQDCCERVRLEDLNGSLKSIEGSTVRSASRSSNGSEDSEDYGTHTWTFYHLRTAHHDITMRWLGESNGYYSESVSLKVTSPEGEVHIQNAWNY